MSINDTIRALDDAREEYKRIKGYDKLARKLILGALATVAGSTGFAIGIDNGNAMLLLIPAAVAFGVGIWFWVYVNLCAAQCRYHADCDQDRNRLSVARDRLRKAEKAHEEATMGGAS